MSSLVFLVADDHKVLRIGLRHLLQESFSDCKVIEARSCQETLSMVSSEDVDLLILDIDFPDGNSLSIIDDLTAIKPDLKILLFSSYNEEFLSSGFQYQAVKGIIQKSSQEEDVLNAVNEILLGGKHVNPNLKLAFSSNEIKGLKVSNPKELLSQRELEIAILMVDGLGNLEICNKLNLNKTTVSTYKKRIFEKLELESIPRLIELFNFYKITK